MKNFLKFNWSKIIIFVILLAISLLFNPSVILVELLIFVKGTPLPICIEDQCLAHPLLILFLIINLIFWYFFSCVIISIWNKFKEKPIIRTVILFILIIIIMFFAYIGPQIILMFSINSNWFY